MFDESKTIDQITVAEDGTILVREATAIKKDGIEVTKTYHRWSFTPGSDISAMPQNVQDIASVVWTPEVIAEYQVKLQESRP